jgi:hypothetical protein
MSETTNGTKQLSSFERRMQRMASFLRFVAIPSFPVALWITIRELPTTAETWGWILSALLLVYAIAGAPDVILHASNGLPSLIQKLLSVLNRWLGIASRSAEHIRRVLGS